MLQCPNKCFNADLLPAGTVGCITRVDFELLCSFTISNELNIESILSADCRVLNAVQLNARENLLDQFPDRNKLNLVIQLRCLVFNR